MAQYRIKARRREQFEHALGLSMDQVHALPNLNLGAQRALEVSQERSGGVKAGHEVAAPRKTQDLRALAAANIKDAPRRCIGEMDCELPGDEFLTDHLPQRAEPSAPLPLTRREPSAHLAPLDLP